jgi:DNA invertase Pin-like site-specific DNA recombinase
VLYSTYRYLQKSDAKVFSFAIYFAKLSLDASMKIGYARVSTGVQNLDLQLTALDEAGCKRIFQEKISGADRNRPELKRLLDQLRAGDTVIVWKLDRLARSTRDLLEVMETVRKSDASFQSLTEPWADTTTHAGKMIMTIFAGIAEFERDLIRERTNAGRVAAHHRGVRFGRPKKLTEGQQELAARLLQEGKSVSEVATIFKVHGATIYRMPSGELQP